VTEFYDPLAWAKRRLFGQRPTQIGEKEPAAPSDR
jgi:hypothetical protein